MWNVLNTKQTNVKNGTSLSKVNPQLGRIHSLLAHVFGSSYATGDEPSKKDEAMVFEARYQGGTMPLAPRLDVAQLSELSPKYLF
jgi:hypothetical protein